MKMISKVIINSPVLKIVSGILQILKEKQGSLSLSLLVQNRNSVSFLSNTVLWGRVVPCQSKGVDSF